MTKEKEIALLQELKGDTYFAQFFGSDIDTMCENIRRDYPIEFGTNILARIGAAENETNKWKLEVFHTQELMVKYFFRLNEGMVSKKFYEYLVGQVGKLFIIKAKREAEAREIFETMPFNEIFEKGDYVELEDVYQNR